MTHAERFRRLSSPLEPIPTKETPQLDALEGIEAVVFDIYGTLVISGSGDIGLIDESNRENAMREAFEAVGATMPEGASTRFYQLIREDREASHVEHPEVEIREIWRKLAGDDVGVEALAIEYECRTNVVWPMPNLVETLGQLRERGLRLGIVSNAQFYTPHLFEAFCNATLDELGFDPELQVFSFDLREGKPSTLLYAEIAKSQDPKRALFVGNDMLKDIWPAQTVGFKTALFAGDQRSLRNREDDPRVAETHPDLVITDLAQLPGAIK
tara:strand:- start:2204 stop:3013 length:810 start_codon:yes stop_codon:yes gene_type:complete